MKDLFASAASSPRSAEVRSALSRTWPCRWVCLGGVVLALVASETSSLASQPRPAPPASAQADWPGCGGVCQLRKGSDFVVLELRTASLPAPGLRLTLELRADEGALSLDVTGCFGEGTTATVALDPEELEALGGSTDDLRAATLAWRDPITEESGEDALTIIDE